MVYLLVLCFRLRHTVRNSLEACVLLGGEVLLPFSSIIIPCVWGGAGPHSLTQLCEKLLTSSEDPVVIVSSYQNVCSFWELLHLRWLLGYVSLHCRSCACTPWWIDWEQIWTVDLIEWQSSFLRVILCTLGHFNQWHHLHHCTTKLRKCSIWLEYFAKYLLSTGLRML